MKSWVESMELISNLHLCIPLCVSMYVCHMFIHVSMLVCVVYVHTLTMEYTDGVSGRRQELALRMEGSTSSSYGFSI